MTDVRRETLAQAIENHGAMDARETEHGSRMLQLLRSDGDLFSRDHFEPGHFTASAFVLSPDRSQLLLILHAKLGMWLQPGGHVEADDDDLIASARREVAEEVGLEDLELLSDGPLDLDIHRIPARPDEPEHEHFDVRYLFRATTLDFRESDEVRGAQWVDLDAVADVHADESVQRAVRKVGLRSAAGS